MNKNLNYISDEELERLISQVEQEELVAAPPDLLENILNAEPELSHLMCCEATYVLEEEAKQIPNACFAKGKITEVPEALTAQSTVKRMSAAGKKEFYAYCFRVITSVAAAVVLVFLLPELTEQMNLNRMLSRGYSDNSMNEQGMLSSENVDMSLWRKDEEIEGNAAQGRWQMAGNTIPSKAEVTEGNTTSNKEEVIEGKRVPSKTTVTAGEVVPSKAEIVDRKTVPSKEAVLKDTGFIEKVINSTGWFNKESDIN